MQTLAVNTVDPHALYLACGIVEAQAIAIVKGFTAADRDPACADFRNLAHDGADKGGRVEGADIVLAATGKVIGVAPVEGFFRLWREAEGRTAAGRAVVLRVTVDDGIEQGAVMRGDVLDVGQVFQAPLDLEGGDAGFDQGQQIVRLVVVLH